MTTKQLLAALALALCVPAFAAGNHAHEHQPLHGGIVTEVADIDYELVAQPDTLTLHLRDHGKPLALDGASAKLTLLNGSEKTEATLSPAGDGKLQAKGSFKVAPGTQVVALVTVPGKKATNVRFAVK